MKLIRSTDDSLLFQLGRQEKRLLLDLLKRYPCLPLEHQPLSKHANLPNQQSSQALLQEALAEQREENKKLLQAFLAAPARLHDTQTGCRLSVPKSDLEWLLQILNDIRIGSWIRLGSPEEKLDRINEQTAPDLWAMEVAGFFQMQILHACQHQS